MNLETKDLKVLLNKNEILKGIDIELGNKEFIGVIGPNGSGKSTLLKCLYRNLSPSSGSIYIDKIEIEKISTRESAKKIGVLAQHNHHSFDFTVLDMVLMGRSPYKKLMDRDTKEDYDIVYEAIDKVNIRHLSNRSFNSLSGGEQQRVILARALAQKTKCLILDEPTNHLDIKYQLQLMEIVKDLGIEVIAAIHDLNIAAMYCDKIYVLKNGEIVAYGTPKDVLTKELIKEVYDVDAKVIKDKEDDSINIIYKGCR
ncbi:ATP-binding cassette domain-containing protein [Paeniclostridium sordellii]|uniref:ABC transporter ATP-binding protein n=1 Tax=Paraclostridium sordellii TaxID=1505 RepID=UPI0012EDB184|nr:ABC transporter ATP-binding protein [Paeniclostridium sordellii]MDU2686166.1 ABC transporter ATP-binding protein [Paeniclostridium sordellii]MVO71594.1 ATP-binding cassette domain-containing protein [Paeniclostridium sordellii]